VRHVANFQMTVKPFLCYGNLFFRKMAAVHHLELFKNPNFCQPIGLTGLICVILPNVIAIGHTIAEMQLFFNIHDGCCPLSWIFTCTEQALCG